MPLARSAVAVHRQLLQVQPCIAALITEAKSLSSTPCLPSAQDSNSSSGSSWTPGRTQATAAHSAQTHNGGCTTTSYAHPSARADASPPAAQEASADRSSQADVPPLTAQEAPAGNQPAAAVAPAHWGDHSLVASPLLGGDRGIGEGWKGGGSEGGGRDAGTRSGSCGPSGCRPTLPNSERAWSPAHAPTIVSHEAQLTGGPPERAAPSDPGRGNVEGSVEGQGQPGHAGQVGPEGAGTQGAVLLGCQGAQGQASRGKGGSVRRLAGSTLAGSVLGISFQGGSGSAGQAGRQPGPDTTKGADSGCGSRQQAKSSSELACLPEEKQALLQELRGQEKVLQRKLAGLQSQLNALAQVVLVQQAL